MLRILPFFSATWCYGEARKKNVSSNQRREKFCQTSKRRRGDVLQSLQRLFFPPPHPSRVSPRCDVTERWRLSRFTVREKSPCSLLPALPTLCYSSSLISALIPSLPCLELALLHPITAFGASSSAT